jgi:hypothetical protein
MLAKTTLEVVDIAEDFLRVFPQIDRADRRNVILLALMNPDSKECSFRLFSMVQYFFELFPYAELEKDDETMTALRKLL